MDRHADRAATLASLRVRWGSAAPRPATEVFGALAAAPLPAEAGAADALPETPGAPPIRPTLVPLPGGTEPDAAGAPPAARPLPGAPARDVDRSIPTGFAELDALLAAGGLPRTGTVTLHGAGSSGATTLALRAAAEAQAGGALVAWVDLSRSLDPVEAVARGVNLEWLAVLVPADVDGALAMAGSLLQARAVDLLVLDLDGARGHAAAAGSGARGRAGGSAERRTPRDTRGSRRPPPLADRLARLVAFSRRGGALLLVLEPTEAPAPVRAALAEGSSLALELRRTGWVRLGREVVGQRTEIRVAKDRHGAPDRRTTLRLLYAEGGPRNRCLARDELLAEEPVAEGAARTAETPARTAARAGATRTATAAPPGHLPATSTPSHEPDRSTDAPPPPRLAPSRAPARPWARSLDPRDRAADSRRAAVG
jgi:RecA/RadA recombinase